MTKFIRVTQQENGRPVLVNTDKVAVVDSKEELVQLHLTELGDTLYVISVLESMEEVQKLLNCKEIGND